VLQADLEANLPSSPVALLGLNESGAGGPAANEAFAEGIDLPWLQDLDANQNGQSDVWRDLWDIVYRDVVILNERNEPAAVYNLTVNNLADAESYQEMRNLLIDVATAERTAASPWQNAAEPLDTTADRFVSAADALSVINALNRDGSGPLQARGQDSPLVDASGDSYLSPIDALLVINHLNRISSQGEGEDDPPALAAADEADPSARLQGRWQIEAFGVPGSLQPASGENRAIVFQDGRLSGATGCNSITASYHSTDDQLRVGPVATTRMACPAPLMQQEEALLEALDQVESFEFQGQGDRLILRGARLAIELRVEDV
jgi:heat shock protein HslJ